MRQSFAAISLALVLFSSGCGSNTSYTPAQQDEFLENRLKAIIDDKALTDQDALEKYATAFPASWRFTSSADVGPHLSVEKTAEGFQMISRELKDAPLTKSSPADQLKQERYLLKTKLDAALRILRHTKPRNVTQVRVMIFTKVSSQPAPVVIFQGVLTQADAQKWQTVPDHHDVGSEYDPRASKINEFCKIEVNRFPELEYSTPEKK
jgi:hypothetical protein